MSSTDLKITDIISTFDLKAHISLMVAILKIQETVQGGPIPANPDSGEILPSNSTLNFIRHAVQRFDSWISTFSSSSPIQELQLPPLDVLMIWHAYMLSPGKYHKDALGDVPSLAKLGGMPWDVIIKCIDASTGKYVPTEQQMKHWEDTTLLRFFQDTKDQTSLEESALPAYSTGLVSAVLRQSQSIIRMVSEVKSAEKENEELWMSRAIIRYADFMRLPTSDHVPPVDVDIVWHTHQLSGTKYWQETKDHFGFHVDHDDSLSVEAVHAGQMRMKEDAHLLTLGNVNLDGPPYCNGPPGGCKKHEYN